MKGIIDLAWFNIRMRVIDYLNKPEDIYVIGYEWVRKIGRL